MSNFIDIYIDERDKSVPHECGICSITLQSEQDVMSAYNNGGCLDCHICFLEPGRGLYGKDWKPTKKQIKDWLKEKKVIYKPRYRFLGEEKC